MFLWFFIKLEGESLQALQIERNLLYIKPLQMQQLPRQVILIAESHIEHLVEKHENIQLHNQHEQRFKESLKSHHSDFS